MRRSHPRSRGDRPVGPSVRWTRSCALAVFVAALAGAAGSARSAESAEEPARGLSRRETARVEEIVVSARKREEFLEETPVSVTALSETTLREAGVTRLDDIRQLVPNLQFAPGKENQEGFISIRGVGTADGQIVFDPGVGIYVDGVFLPRMIGQLIDVIDIGQIEVLRGPQGTLFGKNTVGGAISISTVKPTDTVEGFAFVRPGNFGSVSTRAVLNLPVWQDKVLARLAFGTQKSRGFTFNRLRGEHFNDRASLAFLGTLRILPHDDVVIDISGTWTRDSNHGRGGRCEVVDRDGLGGFYPGFYDACDRSRPFDFEANTHSLSDAESYGTWGTFTWTPGSAWIFDDLAFKSITSWREQRPRHRADLDMTGFPVVQLSFTGGGGPMDGEPWFQQQISQEVQANGTAWDGRINFVGGIFGFWENGEAPTTVSALTGVLDVVTESRTTTDNWTWALYGQSTVAVTDWLSLTGGLRYTTDKKGAGLMVTDRTGSSAVVAQDASDSRIFTSWTPMASVAVTAQDDLLEALSLDHLMTYFTFSRGFRGGGFNALINVQAPGVLSSFDPETLDSFELGVKTIALDQKLTANLSLFLSLYNDIQVPTTRVFEDGEGNLQVQTLTLNAAQATTQGAEFELLALPIDGLQVTGSLGLLDAVYDQFEGISDLDGGPIDRSGQTFARTPQLQTHVSVQYSFSPGGAGEGWLRGWLTPRLEWYYQSSVHVLGPELVQTRQSGYYLLHARLSYDFWDDRAQVALWGKNLTDITYFDQALTLASTIGTVTKYYQSPRAFGGELSVRF